MLSMNKDIRDKVYIDGQWIDDYFLTKEKNQELKNLRTELDTEVSDRKDKQSTIVNRLNNEIERAKDSEKELSNKILEETETRNSQTNILENLVNQEKERAIDAENVINQLIKTNNKNVNELIETLKTTDRDILEKLADIYTKEETSTEIDNAIKSILGDDIDEAYDTLKEISEWIKEHGTEASELTKAIQQNTDKLNELYLDTFDEEDNHIVSGIIPELQQKFTETSENQQETIDKIYNEIYKNYNNEKERNSVLTRLDTLESAFGTGEDGSNLLDDINNIKNELGSLVKTDNNFTDELKDKLENLDDNFDTSNFEIVTNKVNEFKTLSELELIDETQEQFDQRTYPSVAAVKKFVNSSKVEIDESNLVHKDTPELITGLKTFDTKISIRPTGHLDNTYDKHISADEEDLNFDSSITINGIRLFKNDNDIFQISDFGRASDIYLDKIHSNNGETDTEFLFDSESGTLATKEYVENLMSGFGTNVDIKAYEYYTDSANYINLDNIKTISGIDYLNYVSIVVKSYTLTKAEEPSLEDGINLTTSVIFTYDDSTQNFKYNRIVTDVLFKTVYYINSSGAINTLSQLFLKDGISIVKLYPTSVEYLNINRYTGTSNKNTTPILENTIAYDGSSSKTLNIQPLIIKQTVKKGLFGKEEVYQYYNGSQSLTIEAPTAESLDEKVDKSAITGTDTKPVYNTISTNFSDMNGAIVFGSSTNEDNLIDINSNAKSIISLLQDEIVLRSTEGNNISQIYNKDDKISITHNNVELLLTDKIYYNNKEIATKDDLSSLGASALTIENVSGTSVKFIPEDKNSHKIFTITNKGSIEVEDNTTDCNEYSFELTTSSFSNSNIVMEYIGCEGPMNFEFEIYTTYIGKIINKKVCFLEKFDSYENKWIYGTWLSSDFQTKFTFDNTFNFTAKVNETEMSGTYSIEDGMLSLNIDGGSVEIKPITKDSDTQITIGTYGTLSK